MILGTVISYQENEGVSILIDGEETPTEKKYTFLASYEPQENDRVLIEEIGDSYVVLGSITDLFAPTPSGDYQLKSGSTANVVQLVNGSGSVISSVTVNNVDTASNATNAGKSLAIESTAKPYSVQLKNPSGTVLSSVSVSGVQTVFNHTYGQGTNLIKFRNGGSLSNPTLQYAVGTSAWKTLTNT